MKEKPDLRSGFFLWVDRRWEIVSSSGAFISVFFLWSFFWSFHARTDPASIKMAGRQRMLAVPLGHWAAMVALLGLQARSKSFSLHDNASMLHCNSRALFS